MDHTKHARLEMHVPEPEPNVSSWLETGSMEAPVGKRVKTGSMEAPVGSDVLKEKTIPEYDYSQDKDRLQDEVVVVSPPKPLDPSTRRKRGLIIFKYDESNDVYEYCRIDDEESGSDESTSMLTPEDTYDEEEDRGWMLRSLRENFKLYEQIFKTQYSFGACGSAFMMDVRHCITPHNRNAYALPEESSGIMWVGVHTGNDLCVATLRDGVDRTRLQRCLANLNTEKVLSIFRKCVLSELEDPTSKLCEKLHRSIDDVPFCVVSTPTPVTAETFDESGHETSSDAYVVPEAVSFIQVNGLVEQAKASDGAIKLAITAFENLMGKKFEAKEIEVTVASGLRYGRVTIMEMPYP